MKNFYLLFFCFAMFFFSFDVYSQEWKRLVDVGDAIPENIELEDVHFINDSIGWVVGWDEDFEGRIFSSNDGGLSWTLQSSETVGPLVSVFFVNENSGWTVSSYGEILSTNNGGASWSPQISGSGTVLGSVYFIDVNIGWIVGNNGLILWTEDGGINWFPQNSGSNLELLSIYFANNQTGWIVGSFGEILKTEDGGQNWVNQTSGTSDWLESVFFIDSNTGWTVGWNGTILFTEDGGQNWVNQSSGTTNWLESVFFIDSNTGWAVGSRGVILHTENSGQNWTLQSSETTNRLTSVCFTDDINGWVVGGKGEVLLYLPSDCLDGTLNLLSPADTENQTVIINTPIQEIRYEIGGGATGAEASGLPPGVEGIFYPDGIFIIRGSPTVADTFHFSVTTTGADDDCSEATATGTIIVNQAVSVNDAEIDNFRLYQNRPNPFRNETTFGFELPEPANVTFRIFDSSGRLLDIMNHDFIDGYNELKLTGFYPTGLYFFEMSTRFGVLRTKMLVK